LNSKSKLLEAKKKTNWCLLFKKPEIVMSPFFTGLWNVLLIFMLLLIQRVSSESVSLIEGDAIDEDAAKMCLRRSGITSFDTLPFTYAVFKRWPNLSLLNKLPYLVERYFLIEVNLEFSELLSQPCDTSFPHVSETFTSQQLIQKLQDFQNYHAVQVFFNFCDENLNQEVEWMEYLICRGYFDQYGNGNDVSEFDVIENIVRSDFESKLNDPYDPMVLELINKGYL
jgi:hypothetical protein